ncbi:MAG: HAD family hydrolase [Arachnia sp.]
MFSLEGVIVDTTRLRARAWQGLFDAVLPKLSSGSRPRFDPVQDWGTFMHGHTSEDGIRAFLGARGIELPEGLPNDPRGTWSVHGLAGRQEDFFLVELAQGEVSAFPDAVVLLRSLRARGVLTALVSPARSAAAVLDAAGVTDLFALCIDDSGAEEIARDEEPHQVLLLEAARRLGVDPSQAVVVASSAEGVRAAVECRFGLVVGVDRGVDAAKLKGAGAHVVVDDLAALSLKLYPDTAATGGCETSWCGGAVDAASEGWRLVYDQFDPAQEGTREVLCTLGNGYWATRGAVPGSAADGIHYPGTYMAGVFNRLDSDLGGRTIETEHLVNAPDWTWLTIGHLDGSVFRPGAPEMISHHQVLDLRRGVLTRTNRYRDAVGRTTRVTCRQLQSMADPHLATLEVTIVPEDWSGELIVRSVVNGDVANRNVVADQLLASEHLTTVAAVEIDPETVLHEAVTSQSQIRIATAVRTRVIPPSAVMSRRIDRGGIGPGHEITVALEAGGSVTVEKVAAAVTSRDRAVSTAALDAQRRIGSAPSFTDLLSDHETAWAELWGRFGIDLRAGSSHQVALNLHIFHVLQTVAAADADLDASLPARGLHGEGYRGHIFWDELFAYPMLTLRRPELTRAFLLYRHRRLPAARMAARRAGLAGAMFPWQSGSDGREETPPELFNVRNGEWMPDNSHRQRHVGLAVAYSVWQYYQSTGDVGFLIDYGAEVIVEVARLFSSMAVLDESDDRFEITGVMGPDEYHDGYPDASGEGVANNAYTNVLAAWVLGRALETVSLLGDRDCGLLWRRLSLAPEETIRWERLSRRLRLVFHADGIISQFEGYEALEELDWGAYRHRYANIGRLDLILQAETDTPNRYKLSKQADVLMLFYLFSAEELRAIFVRLGYDLPPELIPRTVRYYLERTSHGSTLSRLTHGWVLARTNRAASWSLFEQALEADLADTQGGTTREGIHLGAMAGTADMMIRCYGGVETREDALYLHPVVPDELTAVSFQLRYRGQPITVELTPHIMQIRLQPCSAEPVRICAEGTMRTLRPGENWMVRLSPSAHPAPSQ